MASKKDKFKAMICPQCGEIGLIREVVYGMTGPDFDYEKYDARGCCKLFNAPDLCCRGCRWEGYSTAEKQKLADSFKGYLEKEKQGER